MCAVLQIPRSTYYYHAKERDNNDDIITKHVVQIFKDSRNIYGQRKIKKELHKLGYQVSRRRIGRIMKDQGLVSNTQFLNINQLKHRVMNLKLIMYWIESLTLINH